MNVFTPKSFTPNNYGPVNSYTPANYGPVASSPSPPVYSPKQSTPASYAPQTYSPPATTPWGKAAQKAPLQVTPATSSSGGGFIPYSQPFMASVPGGGGNWSAQGNVGGAIGLNNFGQGAPLDTGFNPFDVSKTGDSRQAAEAALGAYGYGAFGARGKPYSTGHPEYDLDALTMALGSQEAAQNFMQGLGESNIPGGVRVGIGEDAQMQAALNRAGLGGVMTNIQSAKPWNPAEQNVNTLGAVPVGQPEEGYQPPPPETPRPPGFLPHIPGGQGWEKNVPPPFRGGEDIWPEDMPKWDKAAERAGNWGVNPLTGKATKQDYVQPGTAVAAKWPFETTKPTKNIRQKKNPLLED